MKQTSSYENDLRGYLTEISVLFKQRCITWFVSELMSVLVAQGFTFEHLIDGIADYAADRPEFESAVCHLEEASRAVREVLKKSKSPEV